MLCGIGVKAFMILYYSILAQKKAVEISTAFNICN